MRGGLIIAFEGEPNRALLLTRTTSRICQSAGPESSYPKVRKAKKRGNALDRRTSLK